MNIGVVFDAGSAAYASVRIEFFRSLLEGMKPSMEVNAAKVFRQILRR